MGDTAPPQAAGLLGGGGGGGGAAAAAAAAPRVHSAIVERLRARIAICRQHHLSCEGRYERGRAESAERERESTLQLLHLVQHGQAARKGCKHGKAAAATPGSGGGTSAASANATAPPPADYYHPPLVSNGAPAARNALNGEQQQQQQQSAGPGGEQRNPALLALQGSLKRKLVNLSPSNSKRSNGVAESSFLDIKRLRVGDNNLSLGHGHCGNNCQNQSMLGSLSAGQVPQRKVSSPTNNAHSNGNGMFNLPLKEVKKEPGETFSCSKHLDDQLPQGNPFPNRYREDTGEQIMDPELQELFNELTNISVPPMSDLELENMINATIKQDGPFTIDLGQQIQRAPPARPSSQQVDKMVIKQEYSPGLNQTSIGSPQMRPSSTGPAFTMSTTAMSTSSPIPSTPPTPPSQASSLPNRPLANWQEVSHAQQLKQIAANRQQHAMMQCQQNPPPSAWPALSSAEPSSGSFAQEKISSPSFQQQQQQQQFSPQSSTMPGVPLNGNPSKGMNNYIYRSSAMSQGSSINAIMQSRKPPDLGRGYIGNSQLPVEEPQSNVKPLFHFGSEQSAQQMPPMLSNQSKPSLLHYVQQQQQQSTVTVQQQQQHAQQQQQQQQQQQPAQSHQRPASMPLALQQKIMIQKMLQNQPVSGLQYPVPSQHQLDQHSVLGQNTGPNPGASTCTNPNAGSSYINSPQQALLNQQLKQQLLLQQQQQQQQQQQMITEVEKITPQDQLNRHLTRPPPDYKDQRRNQVSMQQSHQYAGGSSAVSISSNLCFPNAVSTSSLSAQASNLLSTAHGTRMASLSAGHHISCYGNIPCSPQSTYNVTPSGASPVPQHRNPNPIITVPNNPTASRQAPPGQGNSLSAFDSGQGINPQPGKPNLNQGTSTPRPPNVMVTSSSAAQSWVSQETGAKQQEARKAVGSPFPTGSSYTNQLLQRSVTHQQFPQRAAVPPSQLATLQIRTPVTQMSQTLNGQMAGTSKSQSTRANQVRAPPTVPHLNPPGVSMTPPHPLSSNHFPSGTNNQASSRAYQGTDHNSDLAFDFLSQQGDNIGPALNSDPDFIDSLLKTEPANDDWMKDINLDEILGGHS